MKKYVPLLEARLFHTLYHGTDDPSININLDKNIFLTKDKNFAKDYGKNILIVTVDLGKIFYSTKKSDIDLLYKEGFQLVDTYDGTEYTTAKEFINSKHSSDTWEALENTSGVVEWIFNNGFNSIYILEGGIVNYLTKMNRVKSYEVLK